MCFTVLLKHFRKPALSRGELQVAFLGFLAACVHEKASLQWREVIGATTIEEYRKYIEKDKALERRRLVHIHTNFCVAAAGGCPRHLTGLGSRFPACECP